ncbi:MAG: ATP-binding protein [Melioribacteraceae bacterium]|nr:ATP-binding protein [Melioribacteraceae bacterium]MCF8354977.1 ATP-binding protein [Melioribacteraceae bacterium]MCF8394006.1 ATP-binding protein [Melioribacteraceae bacterium]MCF8419791.1 ATP-binding protein [Melioribacteraceae bacterium]
MNEEKHAQIFSKVKEIVEKEFQQAVDVKFNGINKLFELFQMRIASGLDKINANYKDKVKCARLAEEMQNDLKELLIQPEEDEASNTFSEDFRDYYLGTSELFDSLSDHLVEQSTERFKCSGSKNIGLCLLIVFKNLAFHISQYYGKIRNKLFSAFGKEKKPMPRWEQSIPYGNFCKKYFHFLFPVKFIAVLTKANIFLNNSRLRALKIVDETDNELYRVISFNEKAFNETERLEKLKNVSLGKFDSLIDDIKQAHIKWVDEIYNQLEQVQSSFVTDYELADTIELPLSNYAGDRIFNLVEQLNNIYVSEKNSLNTYHTGINEKGVLFSTLASLKYFTVASQLQLVESTKQNLAGFIEKDFQLMDQKIKEAAASIENAETGLLLDTIRKNKESVRKIINDKIIIGLVERLPFENVTSDIERHKKDLKKKVSTLNNSYNIIKTNDLNSAIKMNDFNPVDIKDIIENISLYRFISDLNHTAENAKLGIRKIQPSILDIGQVAEYSLDSAASIIEKDKQKFEDAKSTAIEGLTRAASRVEQIRKKLTEITNQSLQTIAKSTKQFNEEITRLNKAEELLRLKIQLSKTKAKKRAIEAIIFGMKQVKNFVPVVILRIKNWYKSSSDQITKITERVGLKEQAKSISAEISDYLIQTDSLINKLPFIYQRLFRNEPLDDMRFFVARDREIEMINIAYNYWKAGRFSSVVITGEKGEGASSLINYISSIFSNDVVLYRKILKKTINTPESLIQYLSELFELDHAANLQEFKENLEASDNKRIAVIENLEELFIRSIDGFNVIHKFFEIINSTSKNVLWIATCNVYSWNYLDKVVQIRDYFSSIVSLKSLTDTQIEDVIMRRHNVSGYQLIFLPSAIDKNQKAYKKLSEEEKQIFLKKKFFSSLNDMCQSNIALAQLFWLRSIKSISNEKIEITSLNEIDFSFLINLSPEKIFVLMALIIHNGLTVEEHSKVFHVSQSESRLMLLSMLDDGILIKRGDVYAINFLLYGYVIKMLKSKNILH